MNKILKSILLCTLFFALLSCGKKGAEEDVRPDTIATIAERLINEAPVLIHIGKDTLKFSKKGDSYRTSLGDFEAELKVESLTSVSGKRWKLHFRNTGDKTIDSVTIFPLYQVIGISGDKYQDEPTVRWFSGSNWRDGQYPPAAFVEHERRFLTNNNSGWWDTKSVLGYKPLLSFGGDMAGAYIPAIQFSLQSGGERVGCTALLEWSGRWNMDATWLKMTDEKLSSQSDFLIRAGYELTNISVDPQEELETPFVHLLYSRGENWDAFTNDIHRYVLKEIAPELQNAASALPVSYDHWFGLATEFDVNELKRQADKAAEIGCEYFTLDAGWSVPIWGSDRVDTAKFPNGVEDLAEHVRSRGMRFGIWNSLEGGHLDFWKPETQKYHTEHIEAWMKKWGIEWMRLEGCGYAGGKNGLKAHKAMHESVYGKIVREHPGFYIEGCEGGGQRLDMNMIRVTHGTWLSDHTGEPDVTRFHQTGALRVWPARYLNMAVETHRNTGDSLSNGHNILSRMVGVVSFNGDIAQWSPEATARVKRYVDIYKQTRAYREQPVFFPLPQPRNDSEWDAAVFGDGTGEAQLLLVYRMNGQDEQFIKIPDAPGKWELLIDNGNARLKKHKDGYIVSLNRNSSAFWIRNKK